MSYSCVVNMGELHFMAVGCLVDPPHRGRFALGKGGGGILSASTYCYLLIECCHLLCLVQYPDVYLGCVPVSRCLSWLYNGV